MVSLRHLSAGDLNTLVGILVDPDYDFGSFAIVLVIVGEKDLELLVYVAETAREERRRRIVISELYRGKFPEPSPGAPEPEGPDPMPPVRASSDPLLRIGPGSWPVFRNVSRGWDLNCRLTGLSVK